MAIDVVVTEPQIIQTRRYRRFKLDVPVRLIVDRAEKVRIIEGRGNELNEGGMAVHAGVELETGEVIEVEFTSPYSAPLRARAAVRDRSGYRYGLEFLIATEEDRERVGNIRVALQGMGKLMPQQ
jgi:CO/xanthine dehydrogenase FAD-binding subunit